MDLKSDTATCGEITPDQKRNVREPQNHSNDFRMIEMLGNVSRGACISLAPLCFLFSILALQQHEIETITPLLLCDRESLRDGNGFRKPEALFSKSGVSIRLTHHSDT